MICAFDRRVTSLQGSDAISGTDKGMKTVWLRYQIASQENRTLVFASSPGSFWHFAICKHYQRAFHTCLETEVRASSWQVESNTLCHNDFQSKSIQLCYIKSTLIACLTNQEKSNALLKVLWNSPVRQVIGQPVFGQLIPCLQNRDNPLLSCTYWKDSYLSWRKNETETLSSSIYK